MTARIIRCASQLSITELLDAKTTWMHYYLQAAERLPHERAAMPLESWKSILEMAYYVFASGAVIGAYLTYRKNSRLEQARWASTFYEKFYETDRYKKVRDILDCPADLTEVNHLVDTEASEFTDYLNFFEHIVIFTETKQLNGQDVEDSFGYYFNCLNKLEKVQDYINKEDKGYEKLRKYLASRTSASVMARLPKYETAQISKGE